MDDYMFVMARMTRERMMQEVRQNRLAAEVCRAARQQTPTVRAVRGPVLRLPHWMAMAAARMRPTATGR
jgi:hypothetical protein